MLVDVTGGDGGDSGIEAVAFVNTDNSVVVVTFVEIIMIMIMIITISIIIIVITITTIVIMIKIVINTRWLTTTSGTEAKLSALRFQHFYLMRQS